MEAVINDMRKDLMQLRKEIMIIKNLLMAEGELSDYAKGELEKARKEGEDGCTSLNDL